MQQLMFIVGCADLFSIVIRGSGVRSQPCHAALYLSSDGYRDARITRRVLELFGGHFKAHVGRCRFVLFSC